MKDGGRLVPWTTRSQRRAHFDDHTRTTLLEDDADEIELETRKVSDKLDRIMFWLVTTALSALIAVVMLTIDIATRN